MENAPILPLEELIFNLKDTRIRTLDLIRDLSDEEFKVPYLPVVNPFHWELGHIGFFYEAFVLHALGVKLHNFEMKNDLFNSFEMEHASRWKFRLPDKKTTLENLNHILQSLLEISENRLIGKRESYLFTLATLHEDMHGEAFFNMRQALSYPCPGLSNAHNQPEFLPDSGPYSGDAEISGLHYILGANRSTAFVFDNEKWGHSVEVSDFKIAKAPVTNEEYLEFVSSGGYENQSYWCAPGWRWKSKEGVKAPIHWKKIENKWNVRFFTQWKLLKLYRPVDHINWYEAKAYCKWANRRLPSETEWEMAASMHQLNCLHLSENEKRTYPWGNEKDFQERANIDAPYLDLVDVACYSAGDSIFGCRQMLGNIWEWTDTPFYPFPGFILDQPYREYSAPWFGYPKILRGGAWSTRSRLIRNTYRNFFTPDRRDVVSGFRTCALK